MILGLIDGIAEARVMRHLRLAALGLVLGSAFASPSVSAQTCNVSGFWQIVHANKAFARMNVKQTGGELTGTGSEGEQVGTLERSFDGRNVEFTIQWLPNNAVGVYQGRISRDGRRMMGQNYNQQKPSQHTSWVIERQFSCP